MDSEQKETLKEIIRVMTEAMEMQKAQLEQMTKILKALEEDSQN
jgi:hypothetical protein